MKKVYDVKLMQWITLFENLSGVKVKDAFLRNGSINFIVNKGDLWRAVGKGGKTVKKIEGLIKKKIKIFEFDEDVCKFVANFIYPIKAEKIELEEGIINIYAQGAQTKGLLIGRESKNLKELKEILLRYFDIEGIKIV
ncbi:unnamed protein product [marine sediment metagenome]|uniref:Uncharacterized protein n=1 Tax=marine sediment metagenome TaxID=412755 RepID=X0VMY1_9ZZZZ